jgi:hypothetical protein
LLTVPGKRAIAGLAAISIVGLIVASQLSNGPPAIAPQLIESQPMPMHQPKPAATFQTQLVQPSLPPHVEKDPSGRPRPQDGYDWSGGNHVSVRWRPGKNSREHPHLIASDTEGEWQPGDGYNWADPTNPGDKSVKWVPGIASDRYPNIVAAPAEGRWRPADGFTWVFSPPRPGDMRVRAISPPADQFSMPVPANAFQRGLADRTDWEQWLGAQNGEFRRGAEWWASRRNLRNPGLCDSTEATNQEFVLGCIAANARLAPTDIRRKSDPVYRRGWNSYTGATSFPTTADHPTTPVEQTATGAPQASDPESADQLNGQELKQLKGQ